MSKDNRKTSTLPVASFVALASMTIGFFIYEAALKSDRPGDIPMIKSVMVGQQVLARLWEDPFEAAVRHHDEFLMLVGIDPREDHVRHGIPVQLDLMR